MGQVCGGGAVQILRKQTLSADIEGATVNSIIVALIDRGGTTQAKVKHSDAAIQLQTFTQPPGLRTGDKEWLLGFGAVRKPD